MHIQKRNRFSHHHGEIQLHGPLDLILLARGDILSNRLRCSLHGFGSHLQISQQFHLLAALIKGSVLTHQRQHAAHSRRELRVFDVQFDVRRKLAGMAVRAQVVGTRDFHLADCRQDRLGAQLPVVSLLAARTREGALVGSWGWEVQQFGQRCCARLMHG